MACLLLKGNIFSRLCQLQRKQYYRHNACKRGLPLLGCPSSLLAVRYACHSEAKALLAAQVAEERSNASAHGPAELLSEHHSLRLHFREAVPASTQSGHAFDVGIYVANEVLPAVVM
jgi:hypothetical protein